MMNISMILLPIDLSPASEAALHFALGLQEKYEAQLHVLHVIENVEYMANMYMFEVPTLPPIENLEGDRRKALDAFLETHLRGRENVTVEMRGGKPFVEILRYAGEMDADVIVITSHGSSGFEHALFGSTTEKVMRKSQCPVLVVRVPTPVAA